MLKTDFWPHEEHRQYVQVSLAHVSLRYICKLLLAGVVAGAAVPGIVYSCAAPPLTAVLLIVQVGACLCQQVCSVDWYAVGK